VAFLHTAWDGGIEIDSRERSAASSEKHRRKRKKRAVRREVYGEKRERTMGVKSDLPGERFRRTEKQCK